jgi:hypothetical protein
MPQADSSAPRRPRASAAHAGFQRANEVAFALPFTFGADDYTQIINDLAGYLGPALGWKPSQ